MFIPVWVLCLIALWILCLLIICGALTRSVRQMARKCARLTLEKHIMYRHACALGYEDEEEEDGKEKVI